jgi:pimeloyl-ACP methyl ester carboxylesterase
MKTGILILSIFLTSLLGVAQEKTSNKNVVFIHGAWSTGEFWSNIETHYQSLGYTVHTPTLKFHSENQDNLKETSIFDYIKDIRELINTLDSKPIVVAHSMGTIVGQKLAEEKLVSKLILIGAPVNFGMLPPKGSESPLDWVSEVNDWKKNIVKPTKEHSNHFLFNMLDSNDQVQEYNKLTYESGQAIRELNWIKNLFGEKPNKIDYKKVDCPILLIYGGKDVSAPQGIGIKLKEKYGNNPELKVFENNAHWMMKEKNWEEISIYIDNWIKQ